MGTETKDDTDPIPCRNRRRLRSSQRKGRGKEGDDHPRMSTSGSESDSVAAKRSMKPKYSKFTQQELPAWKPLYTPGIVIGAFSLIGIIFIPIGLVSIAASQEKFKG
uniref:Uncharacterized protein n=1 Tax=Oryza meridionalis TaxID=40149 RepID=A0A0E0DU53_9ORYZ